MDFSIDWLRLGPAMTVLLCLILLDFIAGHVAAGISKTLNSSVSYIGGLKKVGIFVYIGVGMCFDLLMVNYQDYIGLGEVRPPVTAAAFVALYYCVHEALSVTEKLARCGVPMPRYMKLMLEKLKEKTDGGHGNTITLPTVQIQHAVVQHDSDVPNIQAMVRTEVEQHVQDRRAARAARKSGEIPTDGTIVTPPEDEHSSDL